MATIKGGDPYYLLESQVSVSQPFHSLLYPNNLTKWIGLRQNGLFHMALNKIVSYYVHYL